MPHLPHDLVSASTQGSTTEKMTPTKEQKKYTWEDVKTHSTLTDCWIVVQGKVYDVTSWVPRHPGGKTILTGAGRESTAFMHSYHPRSVIGMLDKYCIGEVEEYDYYYTWDSKFYSTLKGRVEQHLKDHNLTRDSPQMYLTTFAIFALWVTLYYIGMLKGSLIATILFGVVHAQLGINIMHDGNHGAYSSSPWLCSIAAFMMDLMGSSSIVWVHQHNVGHHPNSNNSQKEVDIFTEPLAFDPDANGGYPYIRLNASQPHKSYMRFQHIYIWVLICLLNFKWFVNDIRSMNARRYSIVDFYKVSEHDVSVLYLTKALFVLYAVVIPFYNLGFSTGMLNFLVFMMVTSYAFVLMFSVNHLTEDSSFPTESLPKESRDWAMLQVMTSANFANDSKFWTVVSGGLNFQIEHHLFPGINHVHLPKISPIVKQTCKEFGVPYQAFPSFWAAVYSYYIHLKNLGRPKAA